MLKLNFFRKRQKEKAEFKEFLALQKVMNEPRNQTITPSNTVKCKPKTKQEKIQEWKKSYEMIHGEPPSPNIIPFN